MQVNDFGIIIFALLYVVVSVIDNRRLFDYAYNFGKVIISKLKLLKYSSTIIMVLIQLVGWLSALLSGFLKAIEEHKDNA